MSFTWDTEAPSVAPDARLARVAADLLGSCVGSVQPLGGGRNSRVFRVTCTDGRHYAAKLYWQPAAGERDRLAVEFGSLTFLWRQGVRCIPRPLVSAAERRCAIYEYVDGAPIAAPEAPARDIDASVDFLWTLRGLCCAPASRQLPAASEACFSLEQIVTSIEHRLARLSAVAAADPRAGALRRFLTRKFRPRLADAVRAARARAEGSGRSASSQLPDHCRTLSPSDFGFHNAVRRTDGEVVFLDFEHFGWDDPAKMIADFLLHPGMELSESARQRFATRALARFGQGDPGLAERVAMVFPLFALKWCLILLNEFVPEQLGRRVFACPAQPNEHRQAEQLVKAALMAQRATTSRGYPT